MVSQALRDFANDQNRILDGLVDDILDDNRVQDPQSNDIDVAW